MRGPAAEPPEHWRADAGGDSVAVLDIPGLLGRARVFDIDVSLWVDVPASSAEAWHELALELDGQQQWSRRVNSQNPGQTDGLDYHQRVRLEEEQAVRVRATARVKGVRIRQLLVEAREER
ncbi:hypothetical protein [Hydrogenophaga sp.]|uniref:hypothetical protein n=1 Tax=Hydrogenophaga sp. TaxID=1904254 RepID=UPI0026063C2A|nr:hypothetical protein [Hydrogenophaga sp.]MCW5652374.1 hypothetical protein [Hydrogenophaga sp.]